MKKNNRLIASVAALATLALLAGCTSAAATGGVNTPETKNITLEEAAVIAYNHAGVDESKAIDKSYERDRDHYEIDFEFGGYEYEYDISLTGAILHNYKERDDGIRQTQPVETQPKPAETQPKPAETQPAPAEAKTISLAEAAAIAYAHAGVDESKAYDKSHERDNGKYEIDFDYDGYEYEYDISLEGKILNSRKEKDNDRQPKATEPKATEPKPTESKTISLEEAAAIAFAHAGVKESQVRDKSFEKEHGRYEIDFEYDGYDYEYHISYEGKVLRSHKERDDDHHTEPKPTEPKQEERISSDEALTIALNHAGVSKSDTREREVEWDDGCWEVTFEVGRTEYEYKISAAGKVLRHEKETD